MQHVYKNKYQTPLIKSKPDDINSTVSWLKRFAVVGIWVFMFIGVSYGEVFQKTFAAYDLGLVHRVLFTSYFIAYLFHIPCFVAWAVCSFSNNSPLSITQVTVGYLLILLMHQIIGVSSIWLITGEIIFNIVSMSVGTMFAFGIYIPFGICWCLCWRFMRYKKEIIDSADEHERLLVMRSTV